jgi:hypothetical protein
MLSPSRRTTLTPCSSPLENQGMLACLCVALSLEWYSTRATASSNVTWKSSLKALPNDEYHGKAQSMRFLNGSILASGARATRARAVSRAHRWKRWPMLSTRNEQLGQLLGYHPHRYHHHHDPHRLQRDASPDGLPAA